MNYIKFEMIKIGMNVNSNPHLVGRGHAFEHDAALDDDGWIIRGH
jgi:hypothetical protein